MKHNGTDAAVSERANTEAAKSVEIIWLNRCRCASNRPHVSITVGWLVVNNKNDNYIKYFAYTTNILNDDDEDKKKKRNKIKKIKINCFM